MKLSNANSVRDVDKLKLLEHTVNELVTEALKEIPDCLRILMPKDLEPLAKLEWIKEAKRISLTHRIENKSKNNEMLDETKLVDTIPGVSVELFIKDGDNLVLLGGRQSGILTKSTNSIKVETKENKGKCKYIIVSDEWKIQCNGFYIADDVGIELLYDSFLKQSELSVVINVSNNYVLSGSCVIETISKEFSLEADTKYTISLLGSSLLEKK